MIRRGIPAIPRKCMGKNAMSAPMNINQKCSLPRSSS